MPAPVYQPGLEHARELDRVDELASFRAAFVFAEPELIYLDGNSLGRLPRSTADRLRDAVQVEWGKHLIRGWNLGWLDAPARLGDKIAQLVGQHQGRSWSETQRQ